MDEKQAGSVVVVTSSISSGFLGMVTDSLAVMFAALLFLIFLIILWKSRRWIKKIYHFATNLFHKEDKKDEHDQNQQRKPRQENPTPNATSPETSQSGPVPTGRQSEGPSTGGTEEEN